MRYSTNQKVIGWENAFRGYVVKQWMNECKDRYFNEDVNRYIVKKCTSHYMECWKERNEQFNDPVKQRAYVIEWSKTLESKILQSNKVNAIRYLRHNVVWFEDKTTKYLQSRNRYLMKMYKEDKEETSNDNIRSYYQMIENVE